ncbi:hypothetical protein ALC56_08301, partial [Trachymyrmex septentrionalis]
HRGWFIPGGVRRGRNRRREDEVRVRSPTEHEATSSRLREMLATNRLTDVSYELPRDSREIHSYVRLYEIDIFNVDLLFTLKLTTEMN